ncbi:response regulator transcription factor [Ramlibacter humi]|uniref:response regulator transcription factor n=1 Tax=Ramlibacter humi TaxID=2530451 RepID=UPI00142F4472|nr:response regulator transcription factor [Ramlibacter humi]
MDDHVLVRAGLRSLLGQRFGDRFPLAEAASLSDALAWLKDHAHEVLVLLLDLHLPDTRGLAGLQLVRQLHPSVPVIVVSGLQDARIQDEAALHGAVAYVCKTGHEASLHALLERVEAIATGVGPPRAASPPRAARPLDDRLNKRQVQVLELILSSHDNQAIAHETGLSLGSVKNIVSSIFLVFNVRSRAELIGLFSN